MKKIFSITVLVLIFATGFAQIPSGYYNGTDGLSGDDLKLVLHNIIDDHNSYGYSDLEDQLKYTDEDPANSNNVILLYTGRSSPKSNFGGGADNWNKEHVWAKSHGGFGTSQPTGSDMHNLRPTDASVNSSRGNKHFDNGGTQHSEATECYYTANTWEPRDAVKGDVARMIFYMATRYEGDNGEVDLEVVDYIPSNGDLPYHAMLSTLLVWNEQDPPDDFEENRNNVIYGYQGNRNPYIDHPEWVQCVFGDGCNSLGFTSSPITEAMETIEYNYNITYNTNEDVESITCPTLPSWLTFTYDLGANTALLTGTPTTAGNYDVVLTLTENTDVKTQEFTIVVAPYSATQNIIDEDFANCLSNDWTEYSVAGNKDWQCSSQAMEVNAYDSDVACNDWLISPAINFDAYNNEVLTFNSFNQYEDDGIQDPEMSLVYSTNYSGSGNPEDATWHNLEYSYQVTGTPTFTASGDINFSSITATAGYIAFHYTSSGTGSNSSTLWKVDDVLLIGDAVISINSVVSDKDFAIYPNPNSTGIFTVTSLTKEAINISVYDFNGKEVGNFENSTLNPQIDISQAGEGLFFVKIETENTIIWKKIIIQ